MPLGPGDQSWDQARDGGLALLAQDELALCWPADTVAGPGQMALTGLSPCGAGGLGSSASGRSANMSLMYQGVKSHAVQQQNTRAGGLPHRT